MGCILSSKAFIRVFNHFTRSIRLQAVEVVFAFTFATLDIAISVIAFVNML